MVRSIAGLIVCLSLASSAALAQEGSDIQPNEPKGIYATFLLDTAAKDAYTAAYANQKGVDVPAFPYPALTQAPTNDVLIKYFEVLLDNPGVSGLAAAIPWQLLSYSNPGSDPYMPAAGSYLWEPMDDLFTAAAAWNTNHPKKTPKTIQLLIHPGFGSPAWVFDDIDAGAFAAGCESGGICTGNCDGLFLLAQPPAPPHFNYSNCGYTTIFWQVEGAPQMQQALPLPWNQTYKNDWKRFLITLNGQLKTEPLNAPLVTIAMAGPTSSSTEMILPNAANQKPYLRATKGFLTLSPAFWGTAQTLPGLTVADTWNILLANSYGRTSKYYNNDEAFIEEWERAIDLYSGIFSGTTLSLTTTSDSLPAFPQAVGETAVFTPADGFESDCDDTPDSDRAMACAAVTQVLTYFVNPQVGGNNAKATQEDGLTARNTNYDVGPNGIKWLAATTEAGTAPLPGTPYTMSPMLGGLQMAKSFSSVKPVGNDSTIMQLEGCPTYPKIKCVGLLPSEGFNHVLSDSFFPGTRVAGAYGDLQSVDPGNFSYSDAPINFLQIYSDDILYADRLGNCSMVQITGSPAFSVPPRPGDCRLTPSSPFLYYDAPKAEAGLEAASVNLLSIAETVP